MWKRLLNPKLVSWLVFNILLSLLLTAPIINHALGGGGKGGGGWWGAWLVREAPHTQNHDKQQNYQEHTIIYMYIDFVKAMTCK